VDGYHTAFDAQSIVLLDVALKYLPFSEQLSSRGGDVCPCATIAMPNTIMGASTCASFPVSQNRPERESTRKGEQGHGADRVSSPESHGASGVSRQYVPGGCVQR
jgi:hypothetical protein